MDGFIEDCDLDPQLEYTAYTLRYGQVWVLKKHFEASQWKELFRSDFLNFSFDKLPLFPYNEEK